MKLYVWEEYAYDWSSGLAIAIAENPEQARDMIAERQGWRAEELKNSPDVYELDSPIAFAVCGGG